MVDTGGVAFEHYVAGCAGSVASQVGVRLFTPSFRGQLADSTIRFNFGKGRKIQTEGEVLFHQTVKDRMDKLGYTPKAKWDPKTCEIVFVQD